jgi:hypothetical protein
MVRICVVSRRSCKRRAEDDEASRVDANSRGIPFSPIPLFSPAINRIAGSQSRDRFHVSVRLLTGKPITRFVTYLFNRHDVDDPQLPSRGGCVSARIRVEQRGRTGEGDPAGLFFPLGLPVSMRT